MATLPAAQLEPTIVVLAILILLVGRRTYLNLYGARYTAGRMFAFLAYAVLFFVLFAGTTIYTAIGTWGTLAWTLVVPYLAVPAVAGALTLPHVRRAVQFEERADGQTYYRLPWMVPVLYLVLFTLRLVIEVVLFGFSAILSPTLPTSLPTGVLVVVIGFDLLYAVSVGLLVGRAMGVRQAYLERSLARNPPTAPASGEPLP